MTPATLVFVACVVCCVVGHAAILASVLRQRPEPADASLPRSRRGVEILWAVLPAAVLAVLLVATWARVRVTTEATARPGIIMKVAR